MRMSSKQGSPLVSAMPESTNMSIRMHLMGNTYRMSEAEALELANQLADTVQELRQIESRIATDELQQGEN